MGTLSYSQKKIIKLLDLELTQSQIAKRLNLSRQYVCKFVRKLLEKGLIEQSEKTPTAYNCMYNLIPQLKRQIEAHTKEVQFSACRVHNVRLKYPVTVSGDIALDKKKTGYLLSWEMRGGTRHKFCIEGTAGRPDITIDVHPNSLVAYPDAGQTVYAESIEASKALIISAIREAVSEFIEQQNRFGTEIEVHNPSVAGKLISKIHYGFNFRTGGIADEQTTIEGFWNDNSPTKNGEKGYSEFETENKAAATALDSAVIAISEAYRILGRNPFHVIYDELMEIKQELFNRKDGGIS